MGVDPTSIQEARRAEQAVRYTVGGAGIASIAAAVLAASRSPLIAALGTITLLVLMIICCFRAVDEKA